MKVIAVKDSYIKEIDLKCYFSDADLASFAALPVSQKEDRIAGRIALKHAYHKSFDFSSVTITNSRSGAPIIVGEKDLHCSIAHSYGTGVAAVAPYALGVDIEKIRPHHASLLNYISTPAELKLFKSDDSNVVVTYMWVIKEAVAKAVGQGIVYPFTEMIIQRIGDHYKVVAEQIEWLVEVIHLDDYIIGVARPTDKAENIDFNYLQ